MTSSLLFKTISFLSLVLKIKLPGNLCFDEVSSVTTLAFISHGFRSALFLVSEISKNRLLFGPLPSSISFGL